MTQITLTICASRVSVAAGDPCVAGEANASTLVLCFDRDWDGLAKQVLFRNARGEDPVVCLLTADRLDLTDPTHRTYRLPIPAQPLALAPSFTLVVEGAGEGRVLRTRPVTLPVADAPDSLDASQPADPTPTQAQQLQVQLDTVLDSVADTLRAAQQTEQLAQQAQQSAQQAQDWSAHPPVIGEGGSWQCWDGTGYADTGSPSRGLTGDTGPQGPQGEPGPQGPQGDVPVKGEDYFTAEEVARMVAQVREQVLEQEQYVHIDSIVTEEEVEEIRRTLEPDGTAYRFRRMLVNLYFPAAPAAFGVFVMNGSNKQLGYVSGGVNTVARSSRVVADLSRGQLEGYSTEAQPSSTYAGMKVVPYNIFRQSNVKLDGLRIHGGTFPVGTKIDIYGVRA